MPLRNEYVDRGVAATCPSNARSEEARKRARCVSWLCGQCHGGEDCRCIPCPHSSAESSGPSSAPAAEPTNADMR